jgi:hypothetical protein
VSDLFLCVEPLRLAREDQQRFYQNVQESWDARESMPDGTVIPFRFVVNDMRSFLATAPRAWVDGPTSTNPDGGFPGNLWIGVEILGIRDLYVVERLLALRPSPRILFVKVRGDEVLRKSLVRSQSGLRHHLKARRCPSCGTRYDADLGVTRFFGSTAKTRCDHTATCGSVTLVPQIHLVVSTVENPELESMLQQEGIPLWPQPPLTW